MSSLKRIHVYGHVSAQPQAIANLFGAQLASEVNAESDLAIFAINPAAGIDQNTIDQWQALSDKRRPIYEELATHSIKVDDMNVDEIVAIAESMIS